jgi:hypothetical protein
MKFSFIDKYTCSIHPCQVTGQEMCIGEERPPGKENVEIAESWWEMTQL